MLRYLPAIALVVFVVAGASHADDAQALPPNLVSAQQEYLAALRKADADYIRARIAIKQKYLASVEVALKVATQSANLDAANAVNDQKKGVEGEINDLKEALASGRPVGAAAPKEPAEVTIDAKEGWQNVIHLKKGDIVHLKAEGVWHTYGPDLYACDAEGIHNGKETYPFTPIALPGALIGKLGNAVFLVGKAARIQAAEEGDLQLRINKKDSFLHDDSGQMKVTIHRGAGQPDKTEHRVP